MYDLGCVVINPLEISSARISTCTKSDMFQSLHFSQSCCNLIAKQKIAMKTENYRHF